MIKIEDEFKGWFDYGDKEFNRVLSKGVISFDTNILLSLFRLSNATATSMLNTFDKIKDRIIIPYYVVEEFTRNRKGVIADSLTEYDKIISKVESKYSEIVSDIESINEKKLTDKKKLIDTIKKSQDKVIEAITSEKAAKQQVYKDKQIEKNVLSLLDDRIIDKYSDEEFKIVCEEGIRRQKEDIPPGYMDKEKKENGDYHIFKSLIDYCKANKKDLIFVTEDTKEDWFRKLRGIKEPREELLNEFYKETGQIIIIFTLTEFLSNSKIVEESIDSSALNEISLSFFDEDFYPKKGVRTGQLFNKLLKYTSVSSIEEHTDEIDLVLRTLRHIAYGVDDVKLIRDVELLRTFIRDKRYSRYLATLSRINYMFSRKKYNIVNRINEMLDVLSNNYSNKLAVELLNLFIDFFKQYSDKTMEDNISIVKARELIKLCNNTDDVDTEMIMKNIIEIYDVLKMSKDSNELFYDNFIFK